MAVPKELRKAAVKKLDDMIVLKGVGEVMDGPALSLAIKTIDKYILSKRSLDVQDIVNEFLQAFVDEE